MSLTIRGDIDRRVSSDDNRIIITSDKARSPNHSTRSTLWIAQPSLVC
ncbi:hypothetical protein CKA32_005378 [Geitlerinema sp. FC II]|nr:hypothetical protein CKA32_005378 [Geitlerinema sp. FC II]